MTRAYYFRRQRDGSSSVVVAGQVVGSVHVVLTERGVAWSAHREGDPQHVDGFPTRSAAVAYVLGEPPDNR